MKKLAMSAWCALVFLIVPFALTAQLPSYLPTNGLVAWYPFNGNANDESGNNQNTLGENATLASDRFNNPNSAYYFDGSAFFQNTSINLTSNPGITISTWFKVTDFNEAQGGHLCMFFSEPRSFQVYISYQGITFRVWNYDLVFDLSSNLFTENEWHNVIITSNIINDTKIYLDGELRSQLPNGVPVPQNNSYFTIGKHSFFQPPAGAYKGYLDDIAIYARALNSAEIQQLLNSSSGPSEEGGFGGPVLPLTPSPPGIPYQAEVRNESGEVLANTNVNIRFTLHEQAANGSVSYQETHTLTTNELGLFATTIGAGTAVQGTFASINWAQTTKFLQVEVDTGNGWITMGNQQLMSVPYALYAANGPAGPQGPAGADGQPGPAGIDGIDGTNGVNGKNSMILTTTEPAGVHCTEGGVKVQSGIDANSNNILEESEIAQNSTQYICNGTSLSIQGQGCSGVQIFEFTGQPQLFNIPECANELIIECWGAQGQFGGGKGGYCTGRFYPGNASQLYVFVGGQNGYNGGGIGLNPINFSNQNGGGASDVRTNDNLSSRLIVAGGGGSGYQILFYNNNSIISLLGGDGGSCSMTSQILYEGEAGTSAANIMQNNNCGASATTGNFGNLQNNWARASGGGFSGGISACNGNPCSTTDGQLGQGGNGQVGGGGGYYGGGGASANGTTATIAASAGGGSSWTGGCEPPYYFIGGSREGNGKVRITWH